MKLETTAKTCQALIFSSLVTLLHWMGSRDDQLEEHLRSEGWGHLPKVTDDFLEQFIDGQSRHRAQVGQSTEELVDVR